MGHQRGADILRGGAGEKGLIKVSLAKHENAKANSGWRGLSVETSTVGCECPCPSSRCGGLVQEKKKDMTFRPKRWKEKVTPERGVLGVAT